MKKVFRLAAFCAGIFAAFQTVALQTVEAEPIIIWSDAGKAEIAAYQIGGTFRAIAENQSYISALDADNTCDIYWFDQLAYKALTTSLNAGSSSLVLRSNSSYTDLTVDSAPQNPNERLFLAQSSSIYKGPLITGPYQDVAVVNSFDGLRNTRGIALDAVHRWLYWTDSLQRDSFYPPVNKIRRVDLSGGVIQDLVVNAAGVNDLAVDPVEEKLYWADNSVDGATITAPRIRRSDLDGGFVEDIITTGLKYVSRIAVDGIGRKLYWTDLGTGKLQRANLDGTNVEDVKTDLAYGLGLTVVSGDDCSDSDNDGIVNMHDACPLNPAFITQGVCGCAACPTATATPTATITPTRTATVTITATATTTVSPIPTATAGTTTLPTETATASPSPGSIQEETPLPTVAPIATIVTFPTAAPTATAIPPVRGITAGAVIQNLNRIIAGARIETSTSPVPVSGRTEFRLALSLPRFQSIIVGPSTRGGSGTSLSAFAAQQRMVPFYDIFLQRRPAMRQNDTRHTITRRNSTSFSKLREGRYTVRYRIELRDAANKKRAVSRSKTFSVYLAAP